MQELKNNKPKKQSKNFHQSKIKIPQKKRNNNKWKKKKVMKKNSKKGMIKRKKWKLRRKMNLMKR